LPSDFLGLLQTGISQLKEALNTDLSDEERAQKEKDLEDLELYEKLPEKMTKGSDK